MSGSWEAEPASGGRREVGVCCQRPRVGGAAPAAGQGRVVVPSRCAAAEAAPAQCQICDSAGGRPPFPRLRIGSGTAGGFSSPIFLGSSVRAGVHFTNSAGSVYYLSVFASSVWPGEQRVACLAGKTCGFLHIDAHSSISSSFQNDGFFCYAAVLSSQLGCLIPHLSMVNRW